jgi:hypothetical protein
MTKMTPTGQGQLWRLSDANQVVQELLGTAHNAHPERCETPSLFHVCSTRGLWKAPMCLSQGKTTVGLTGFEPATP